MEDIRIDIDLSQVRIRDGGGGLSAKGKNPGLGGRRVRVGWCPLPCGGSGLRGSAGRGRRGFRRSDWSTVFQCQNFSGRFFRLVGARSWFVRGGPGLAVEGQLRLFTVCGSFAVVDIDAYSHAT